MKLYVINMMYVTGLREVYVWADNLYEALNKVPKPLYVDSFYVLLEQYIAK